MAKNKSEKLQGAVDVLEKQKRKNIQLAKENPGLCGLIAIALILTFVAFPTAGVLVLFA